MDQPSEPARLAACGSRDPRFRAVPRPATPSTCSSLGQEPVVPLCVLRARAIGVLTMSDDKGQDDKIIAVHVDDPEYAHYRDVGPPPHRLKEIQRFFLDYKVLENKAVDVDQIRGRSAAERVIRDAIQLYRDRIAPTLPRPGVESP